MQMAVASRRAFRGKSAAGLRESALVSRRRVRPCEAFNSNKSELTGSRGPFNIPTDNRAPVRDSWPFPSVAAARPAFAVRGSRFDSPLFTYVSNFTSIFIHQPKYQRYVSPFSSAEVAKSAEDRFRKYPPRILSIERQRSYNGIGGLAAEIE